MLKRTLAVSVVFLLAFTSCKVTKVEHLPAASVPRPANEKIVGITTTAGQDVRFDAPGASVSGATLHASVSAKPYEISLSEIQRFWVERKEISKVRTIGLVAGVAAGTIAVIVAVAAATKQSCPFVYSWNGTEYVFDAEPYGGAITRGLEKDDYSELEHLREQDNRYRLRITNEVDEQQYTNLMELWVVDHDPGTRVLADQDGHLHTVGNVRELLNVRDSAGADLAPWLRATDRLIWEPEALPDAQGNLRHEITMEFPKPPGATSAKLVVNAATGLWGSYMIKKMVELRGRAARDWFWKIDHDPAEVRSLFAWDLREELFALKIYVQEPTGWEVRGVLQGMGPF
ncbi:MAG: hypothetical protein JOZ62_19185, partial [Acidobacteriaceae bacterium]|nr:hypothetical protein [Acidobacteriaceae bacterium]